MRGFFMHGNIARRTALLLTFVLLAPPIAAAPRRGPDLAKHWTEAIKSVGSVEVAGMIARDSNVEVLVTGRIGPGYLDIQLLSPAHDARTRFRCDPDEFEANDPLTGWTDRVGWSGSADLSGLVPVSSNAPFIMNRDPFGLRPPVSSPRFLHEDESGAQIWDYQVSTGDTYRVWLSPGPLRLTRLEIRDATGRVTETFSYLDHDGISARLVLPRGFVMRNELGASTFTTSMVVPRPPLPDLPALPPEIGAIYRMSSLLNAEPAFRHVADRLNAFESPAADTYDLRRREEARALLLDIANLDREYRGHPLLEMHAARAELLAENLDSAAKRAIRSVRNWPRTAMGNPALTVAAEVGSAMMNERGDSTILMWAFERALPRSPDDLTNAQSEVLSKAVQIAIDAMDRAGQSAAATAIAERAFLMNPSHSAIRRGLVERLVAVGTETRALAISFRHVASKDSDIESIAELGELIESMNRHALAILIYRYAAERFPDDWNFRMRLARIYWKTKDWTSAQGVYAGLLDWMDRGAISDSTRAQLYHEMATNFVAARIDVREARRLMSYALAIDPTDPHYWDTMGMTQLLQGDKLDARASFEKALVLKDDPEFTAHLGLTAP